MDKKKIIDQFKKKKTQNKLMTLRNGGQVVGESVDEDNHLYYVIEHQGVFSVESAENKIIGEVNLINQPVFITVENSSKKE